MRGFRFRLKKKNNNNNNNNNKKVTRFAARVFGRRSKMCRPDEAPLRTREKKKKKKKKKKKTSGTQGSLMLSRVRKQVS